MPPKPRGLIPATFRLDALDDARLDRIAAELVRRGRPYAGQGRTAALRWALAELDARLAPEAEVERGAQAKS
jgi:hypothetical protein